MQQGIPFGFRDILPDESKERRVIEKKIIKTFELWGYNEAATSSFEYFDSISRESGELIKREAFKLFDSDGNVLALRPEMTTPIARMVAQRMSDVPLPVRLYYLQNVFRQEEPQRGQQREFYQAGIELIGTGKPASDAEILLILMESLKSTGLDDFKISVGQIAYVKSCLDSINITGSERNTIIKLMAGLDIVALESFLKTIGKGTDIIRKIVWLKGANALSEARNLAPDKKALNAVENLQAVYELICEGGCSDYIDIDFGVARNFDYYTGIIFEGYSPGLGFSFCGGGRYDNLLNEFGYNQPATGFQIGIERLQILLSEKNIDVLAGKKNTSVIVGGAKNIADVFSAAQSLREEGINATILESSASEKDMINIAKERKFNWLVIADAKPYKYIDLSTNEEYRKRPDFI